jgi:hypothetical protein
VEAGMCDLQVDSGLDDRVTVVDISSKPPPSPWRLLEVRNVTTSATGVVFIRSPTSIDTDAVNVLAGEATHVFFDRRIEAVRVKHQLSIDIRAGDCTLNLSRLDGNLSLYGEFPHGVVGLDKCQFLRPSALVYSDGLSSGPPVMASTPGLDYSFTDCTFDKLVLPSVDIGTIRFIGCESLDRVVANHANPFVAHVEFGPIRYCKLHVDSLARLHPDTVIDLLWDKDTNLPDGASIFLRINNNQMRVTELRGFVWGG